MKQSLQSMVAKKTEEALKNYAGLVIIERNEKGQIVKVNKVEHLRNVSELNAFKQLAEQYQTRLKQHQQVKENEFIDSINNILNELVETNNRLNKNNEKLLWLIAKLYAEIDVINYGKEITQDDLDAYYQQVLNDFNEMDEYLDNELGGNE